MIARKLEEKLIKSCYLSSHCFVFLKCPKILYTEVSDKMALANGADQIRLLLKTREKVHKITVFDLITALWGWIFQNYSENL